MEISDRFPRYTEFDPAVPVWCITPNEGRCIHRFFDTSPISPSGRYVALTRLPCEDRMPEPGEMAQVVLVDLETGEERAVAETAGWDTQLGAQTQWGADDTQLCFNDVEMGRQECLPHRWRPFGVVMDPLTGERRDLEGTHYMVSRDGTRTASPCLLRTARTQAGYGVLAPPGVIPENVEAVDDDGVYVTDMATGRRRLLVSFKDVFEATNLKDRTDIYSGGAFYAAHVKWNPQGTRLMLVLRWKARGIEEGKVWLLRPHVVTMNADGSDIRMCIDANEWLKRGHHPDWCPDGDYVMMNLAIHGRENGMRLVRARYDGSDYGAMTEAVLGSGHPSMHPDGRHIVTDAYPGEPMTFDDRTIPLRLIDVAAGTEKDIVRINTVPDYSGPNGELRVDPHPAWDRTYARITFNAFVGGTRRVFVADLTQELNST